VTQDGILRYKRAMSNRLSYKFHYHRTLPHIQSEGATFFVTFRLAGSLPGIKYLSDARVADVVVESLHFRDGKMFDLIAFCVMPNHVHIVFTPLQERKDRYFALSKIMHSLKLHTAHEANRILNRVGPFWQHENYDHFIRDEAALERIIKYVLYNPVKAGLVIGQNDWKWAYCKYEM